MVETTVAVRWHQIFDQAVERAGRCPFAPGPPARPRASRIAVIGVGGAGVNTVARLADMPMPGVSLWAVDTSAQTLLRVGALRPAAPAGGSATAAVDDGRSAGGAGASDIARPSDRSSGALRPIVMTHGTRGLGSGGDVRKAEAAARAAADSIRSALDDAGIVFVVAGLAGGTGGGAAPLVARMARAAGAITLGFGILPFAFESASRRAAARRSRSALEAECDSFVELDNARAVALAGHALGFEAAMRVADDAVRQAVEGLADLFGPGGWIDIDVARALDVLRASGTACVALGAARLDDGDRDLGGRADEDGGGGGDGGGKGDRLPDARPVLAALEKALESPLGGMCGLSGARAAMLQICAGPELAIADVADAADLVKRRLPSGAELFVGASSMASLAGAARVTILGAGIGAARSASARPTGATAPAAAVAVAAAPPLRSPAPAPAFAAARAV